MELNYSIQDDFLGEVARIAELYEDDVSRLVTEALSEMGKEEGLDLIQILYPILANRSMADGLPVCIILQMAHKTIDKYIADSSLPHTQQWLLSSNGQIIVCLMDEVVSGDAVPDLRNLLPLITNFFDGVVNDLTKRAVGSGASFHLDLNEILCVASVGTPDLHHGEKVIALIDQTSVLAHKTLQDIKENHPSIGGTLDWYIAEGGRIVLELFLGEKQAGI